MRGIPSLAEAQRAYAAYQQYNELDKQYGITDKAIAGTNPRARPPTNPTRPPPPQRPRPPAPRVDEERHRQTTLHLFRVPIRFPSLAFLPSRPPVRSQTSRR